MGQGLYKRFKCLKILKNFLCIYLGEGRGGALRHVYEWEHRMFTKLDRDEVLIITHLFIGFSANSTQGGGGNLPKIGQWGVPSPKDFFFRSECTSNKPNASPYPELKYCDCCCSD